jgi:ribosomal-protein-alanine N-acetyltransferase
VTQVRLSTPRLELLSATLDLLRAELESPALLAQRLGAAVPPTWPPQYYDPPAVFWTMRRLEAGAAPAGWYLWYFLLRTSGEPLLLGAGGFQGPPAEDGSVEVGYSIVPEHHRRGYASEAVAALLAFAFDHGGVRRVLAETLPELAPSIGVLRKRGFAFVGAGSEPGVIRFELTRSAWEASTAGMGASS